MPNSLHLRTRSSPRYSVASRSGGNDKWIPDDSDPEGSDKSVSISRSERPESGDGAEITVRLKIGYKTVLLVVVVFDLIHLSLREFIDTNFFEQLLN